MQYHIEHHMFPNVPGFNLPRLRKLIGHDLPPAPRGLWTTWKDMLEIHRKRQTDPDYCFMPDIPSDPDGDVATDLELSQEASGAVA